RRSAALCQRRAGAISHRRHAGKRGSGQLRREAMRCNPALLLLLLPLVAACATPEEEYPSLAIRDAERIGGSFEPATPAPYVPPPTPPAVLGQLEALRDQAASAHRAFLAEVPGARRAIGSAGGVGSEG